MGLTKTTTMVLMMMTMRMTSLPIQSMPLTNREVWYRPLVPTQRKTQSQRSDCLPQQYHHHDHHHHLTTVAHLSTTREPRPPHSRLHRAAQGSLHQPPRVPTALPIAASTIPASLTRRHQQAVVSHPETALATLWAEVEP